MKPTSADCEQLHLEAIRAFPDGLERWVLALPSGSTLGEAIDALAARGIAVDPANVGIWGRRRSRTHVLQPGDRIELYRPLLAEPRSARIDRARQQGYRWQARTRRAAAVRPESSSQ